MFYKRKADTIFREYEEFGYLTDNRNYGYKAPYDTKRDIGDKIISQSGMIFLKILGNEVQNLDSIAQELTKCFPETDSEILKKDAKDFFDLLVQDGFVVCGHTRDECEAGDISFSYKFDGSINPERLHNKIKESKSTPQDYLEDYYQGKPYLSNVHIEITSRCNERCIHCYIPHENKIKMMSSDMFYDILEQCRKMNVLHINISGGEPMLHAEFIGFLRKCNEYNFSVNVLSNLTLLNDDIIYEMQKNPLLSVQTSLYAMDAEVHDAITQVQGSFQKTRDGILRLIEHNIPLQISCPILKQNEYCYKQVEEWGMKHNVAVSDDYVIIAKYNHDLQNLQNRLPVEEVQRIIEQKSKEDSNYINKLKLEAERKKEFSDEDAVCSVCYSSVCIAETGKVYPCAGWQDCVVGDVKKSSLNEIWGNSDKILRLRNLKKKDFPKCCKCDVKQFCTMCMVRNANENPQGNPMMPNEYYCEIARFQAKLVRNSEIGDL